jgi:LDH2 family malate/lactate/ureidoglycolate dehydrogenase
MVNDSGGLPSVAPFGGAARFYSTNPIGAGIPRGDEEPILIDMSTAVTSVGRIRVDAQRGDTIPHGWLIDHQGESVVNPARFFTEPENVSLLPLGGMLAGHKGFALQLLVDVLAGALGGAGVSTGEDPGMEANALLAIAIDPEHFASRKSFTELVDRMVAGLRNVKTLPGVEAIRIPGERAANERHIRQVDGIPLSSVMRNELATVLLELDLIDKYRNVLDGRTQA